MTMNLKAGKRKASPARGLSELVRSDSLTDHHEAYLAARCVSRAVAELAGLRAASAHEVGDLLGLATIPESGGIVIPYPESDYVRVRMDGGPVKFLCPSGLPIPLYAPPGCPVAGSEPLVIVEGPIKAIALQSYGISAVGLGGTATCLVPGARRLNDSWNRFGVKGRCFVIVFDSGRATNPHVARDEARLAFALEAAGAEVKSAALPHGTDGADWGPDDFLCRNGADQLRSVIAAAVPTNPLTRIEALLR